jgi:hypothetical protein
MSDTIPDSLIRYQHALEQAVRRDVAGVTARHRRRRVGIRFVLAAVATATVVLGALNLLVSGAPSTAPPAAAAIIRQAAAALAQAPGAILQIKFTATQDNGNGTTVSWSQESFSEQRPPYDTRLVNERLPGTPPGVEQATVSGVSQVYDPTRNTIYIGPPPANTNVHHYLFSPGPAAGTYRVRVPIAYRFSARTRALQRGTVYRTVIVTVAQAKALRDGTKIVAWTRHGNGDRVTNPRVVRAPRASSANDASSLDPFSATFRGQILSLLRSGDVRVTGHVTVDGHDTIKIESAHGHTTYYVAPDSYEPVELTTKGTSGGSILRFDTYKTLPAPENTNLLSLIAEHPTAIIDRNVADYQAAEARLFPHG